MRMVTSAPPFLPAGRPHLLHLSPCVPPPPRLAVMLHLCLSLLCLDLFSLWSPYIVHRVVQSLCYLVRTLQCPLLHVYTVWVQISGFQWQTNVRIEFHRDTDLLSLWSLFSVFSFSLQSGHADVRVSLWPEKKTCSKQISEHFTDRTREKKPNHRHDQVQESPLTLGPLSPGDPWNTSSSNRCSDLFQTHGSVCIRLNDWQIFRESTWQWQQNLLENQQIQEVQGTPDIQRHPGNHQSVSLPVTVVTE